MDSMERLMEKILGTKACYCEDELVQSRDCLRPRDLEPRPNIDISDTFKEILSIGDEYEIKTSNIQTSQQGNKSVEEILEDLPRAKKETVSFLTESSYTGEWNALGMHGKGIYKTKKGAVYNVPMKDGVFHGKGTVTFPNSTKIEGNWVNGVMQDYKVYFDNEEETAETYLTPCDRRYYREKKGTLKPQPRPLLTAEAVKKDRVIPKGFYDVGDGFYDPKTLRVVHYKDINRTIRIPTVSEANWIMKNCRRRTKHSFQPDDMEKCE